MIVTWNIITQEMRQVWRLIQDQGASMWEVLALKRWHVNVCGFTEMTKVKVTPSLQESLMTSPKFTTWSSFGSA